MRKIKQNTMKNQAYQIIRKKILNQSYAPGEKISIASLTEELQISNTPIREALSMLEEHGLVEITPNSGFRMKRFTQDTFRELTDAFVSLLLGGYRMCIVKKKIPQLLEAMEEQLKKQRIITSAYSDFDIVEEAFSFDQCFVNVLENERLNGLCNSIFDLLFLAGTYEQSHNKVAYVANIREHEAIFQAVREGNHEKVEILLYQHFAKEMDF
ncbi:MAG: GntR family transcriptional regulator [Blautia sp.]